MEAVLMKTVEEMGSSLANRLTFARFSQKFLWKRWYPLLTRRLSADDVLFLNMGYEEDPPMALSLEKSDEANRFYIQLYHRTATQVDLNGARVLEVSCGHGGGASYLARTLRLASYTGLDRNTEGVAFCRDRHNLPGLDFVQGDAENLPFGDQCFDAVINVEASHCYPRFARFLAEVARVLRPGGHFLYADARPRHLIAEWESAIIDAPMQLRSGRIVNAEVLRGIEKNHHWSLNLSDQYQAAFVRRFAHAFTVGPGSAPYRDLQRGELSFRMYWFTKNPASGSR
jgi:ubiquinone/menaquinone biosynthesis C-methylase UbiE